HAHRRQHHAEDRPVGAVHRVRARVPGPRRRRGARAAQPGEVRLNELRRAPRACLFFVEVGVQALRARSRAGSRFRRRALGAAAAGRLRMSAASLIAAVMLAALVLYALLAGADFGGGVWDLLAFGPRAKQQRALIEHALAPVWEANHVWLILIVVLLFTAFPAAFAALMTGLHTPLMLMLLGIVLRGSAFVFRQYGAGSERASLMWGRVFAVAS